jgi:GDP-4-dehydro-6-deoxy-D-mannose reductase
MRALITGINGFVGGYLAEHLLLSTHPWHVSGISRQQASAANHLPAGVELITADLTDADQVAGVIHAARPDVIFHLAAQANVPRSFADPVATFENNVFAQLRLFQALIQQKIDPLIVIAGSAEIYGMIQPEDLPVDEETPLRPANPYAVAKAAQDLLAYQYHISHRLRTVRLRLFNHIGPRQTEQYVAAAFAAQIARVEAGKQPPLMRVGNLAAERDFTDVRDVVRAYELAALYGEPGAAYNIGSDRAVSVRWLLDTLLTLSTHDITVEPDPARMRPSDVPQIVSDSRRFRERTGWAPDIPLEQTLSDILVFWREQI